MCSSEDLTQPKTNKQKNVMNAEFGALKSSRLPDQQATRGTKVQERCPPDLGRDPWGTHGPPPPPVHSLVDGLVWCLVTIESSIMTLS